MAETSVGGEGSTGGDAGRIHHLPLPQALHPDMAGEAHRSGNVVEVEGLSC